MNSLLQVGKETTTQMPLRGQFCLTSLSIKRLQVQQSHLRCEILVIELKCKLNNVRIPHTKVTQLFNAIDHLYCYPLNNIARFRLLD